MYKIQRGLVVAAAFALCATAPAFAGDGGDGGDSGDNGMNPMYGDSFAATEHKAKTSGIPASSRPARSRRTKWTAKRRRCSSR